MSTIMLIALVIIFAVIFAMRRSRRPRVTHIDRTARRTTDEPEDHRDA